MYVCIYVFTYVHTYACMTRNIPLPAHCQLYPQFLHVLYFYICSMYKKANYIFLLIK